MMAVKVITPLLKKLKLRAVQYLVGIVFSLCGYSTFGQTTIPVSSLADGGAGSLREALTLATDGDVININVRGTIQLTSGSLLIDKGVTINGPFPTHLTIDGTSLPSSQAAVRVSVPGGNLALVRGIRFTKQGASSATDRGAIEVTSGQVDFEKCVFEKCEGGQGGGIYVSAGAGPVTAKECSFVDNIADRGAAVFAESNFESYNSTYSQNTALTEGGAFFIQSGTTTIAFSTIIENEALNGPGGGIQNSGGTVELGYSIVADNTSIVIDPNVGSAGGTWTSMDGNVIQSDAATMSFIPLMPADVVGSSLVHGLRPNLLIDGYGLQYYPIVANTSPARNRGSGLATNPANDQKRAYRRMEGAYDAGACEFTPYFVTSNSGTPTGGGAINGSLGWAIDGANASPDPVAIWFDLPLSSTEIITNGTYQVNTQMRIDGYTQPGSMVPGPKDPVASNAITPGITRVQIRDNSGAYPGFSMAAGIQQVYLSGLSIQGFEDAIVLNGTMNSEIFGNHIGLDSTGLTNQVTNGRGILVTGSSVNINIGGSSHYQRNVISTSQFEGIEISGAGTGSVQVSGNIIGLDALGLAAFSNDVGVSIEQGAENNVIGGLLKRSINLISSNTKGVECADAGINNSIEGNWIGLDISGQNTFASQQYGVWVDDLSSQVRIGGANQGAKNIISGHSIAGIELQGASHLVFGNFIGTDTSGTVGLGNGSVGGIYLNDANNVSVGGSTPGEGNLISGNTSTGVFISGGNAVGNAVRGNYIGLASDGTSSVSSQSIGVDLTQNASSNYVGGPNSVDRNYISGNLLTGILIDSAFSNFIRGNYVGLDSSGTQSVPNGAGVELYNSSANNTIGGVNPGEENVISGNSTVGVRFDGADSGNLLQGNIIGLQPDGISTLPSQLQKGVEVVSSLSTLTIGGTTLNEGNVISGNNLNGIEILDGSVEIYGNMVGVDVAGVVSGTNQGNGNNGIRIEGGTVLIGDPSGTARNVISNNDSAGVYITGPSTVYIDNNYIGTEGGGGLSAGNALDGILIEDHTISMDIGSVSRNIISGNTRAGIYIDNSSNVGVWSNYIGTDAAGSTSIANQKGVWITNGSSMNQVGAQWGIDGNVISGNTTEGVFIEGTSTTSNNIAGNAIGLTSSGSMILSSPGQTAGIHITASASQNFIGGDLGIDFNKIGGNFVGIKITGGASQNEAYGNYIGLEAAATPFPNDTGVLIGGGANNNLIGGDRALNEHNVITDNLEIGLVIKDPGSDGNEILGNLIGVIPGGINAVGNGPGKGILIANGAMGNVVGSTVSFEGNIIGGHADDGVRITDPGSDQNIVEANIIGLTEDGSSGMLPNQTGLGIRNGASNNIIRSNVVSGNLITGIEIVDVGSNNNRIHGNIVGLDIGQNTDMPNTYGVAIHDGPQFNWVGDTVPGGQNVLTGNNEVGLAISNADFNEAYNNYIGTDAAGNPMPAGSSNKLGLVLNSANGNIIGDGSSNHTNIISGNEQLGALIDSSSSSNVLSGNFIGIDFNGNVVPNAAGGLWIRNGSNNNEVGRQNNGNIISGNSGFGVKISDPGTANNSIKFNGIGWSGPSLTTPNDTGIVIVSGAVGDTIRQNVISGNNTIGILISGFGTNGHAVGANIIGADDQGLNAVPNTIGIMIRDSSKANIIGTNPQGNLISGNSYAGIVISDTTTGLNAVYANFIGADINGTSALPNKFGIILNKQCNINNIGAIGEANLISGNDSTGIVCHAGLNVVRSNLIGVDINGTNALPNGADGIWVDRSAALGTIGGNLAGQGNVISGNLGNGIKMDTSSFFAIRGNIIGLNTDSTTVVSNGGNGIHMSTNSVWTSIGHADSLGGNIISGNTLNGIYFNGATGGHVVTNNYIGTDGSGTVNFGNGASGIKFENFMLFGNLVGDSLLTGPQNIIAFNNDDGITVINDGGNRFYRNSIHSNGDLGIDLDDDGVTMNDSDDSDTGANGLQNFPVINAAFPCGGGTVLIGTIVTNPNRTIRVEAFTYTSPDPSGYGEGETFLGFDMDTTDAGGQMTFEIFSPTPLSPGEPVTVNATDVVFWSNTSEFGLNSSVTTVPGPPIVSSDTSYCQGEPIDSLYATGQVGGTLVWYADSQLTTVIDTANAIVPDTSVVGTTTYYVSEVVAGCSWDYSSVSVTVNPVDDPTFSYQPFCAGDTGVVDTIYTPGGIFSFNPDPGDGAMIDSLTGDIINATAGSSYAIQYLTGGVCPDSMTVTVVVNDAPQLAVSTTDPSCSGTSDGSIMATASGGVTPYNFFVADSSNTYSGANVTGLSGGSYVVTVIDSNGCEDTVNVTLNAPAAPVVNMTIDSTLCYGSCDGQAAFTVSGSAGPYTPEWFDSTNTSVGSSATLTSACSGDYLLVLTGSNGCQDSTFFTIESPDSLSFATINTNDDCGTSNGSIEFSNVQGGSPPYDFSIDGGTTYQQNVLFSGLSAGTYSAVIQDDHGCTSGTLQITLTGGTQPPPPTVNNQGPYCEGQPGNISATPQSGGQLAWFLDTTGTNFQIGPNFDMSNLPPGQALIFVAEFAGGCWSNFVPVIFTIVANDLSTSPDETICLGDSVELSASGTGSVSWTNTGAVDSTNIVQPGNDTVYYVLLTNNGCVFEDSVIILVDDSEECGFEIYTAFSPDDDGVNDTWTIPAANLYPNNRVVIFNRWGDELIAFENYNNMDVAWDGRNKNGEELPQGTYFYTIKLDGIPRSFSGWVQIVR